MPEPKNNFIIKSFKANPLVWVTTAFSSILLVLNVWLTYRLLPVEESLRVMNTRIESIEIRNQNVDPLIERFYKVEEKQTNVDKGLEEVKSALIRLESKLDRVIEKSVN